MCTDKSDVYMILVFIVSILVYLIAYHLALASGTTIVGCD